MHCPLRHTTPSSQNFQPPKQLPTHPRDRERLATVCKHWLRGLCKKGDACEFLHEYNLRRMPECWWFAKYGYCSAGDECLYAHPKERRVECPDYKRGFCKLGELFSLHNHSKSSLYDRSHMSSKARPTCSLPIILDRLLPIRPRVSPRTVSALSSFLRPIIIAFSPKPSVPLPRAYEPPSPPSNRDLGPPPPGYGRYADYDRGTLGGPAASQGNVMVGSNGPRRNLDDVLCFKVSFLNPLRRFLFSSSR